MKEIKVRAKHLRAERTVLITAALSMLCQDFDELDEIEKFLNNAYTELLTNYHCTDDSVSGLADFEQPDGYVLLIRDGFNLKVG